MKCIVLHSNIVEQRLKYGITATGISNMHCCICGNIQCVLAKYYFVEISNIL